ncbi:hypothetical protein TKK_0017668 [Trichogramma kaykai]
MPKRKLENTDQPKLERRALKKVKYDHDAKLKKCSHIAKEAGLMIQIHNAIIKPANKSFNPTGNRYELAITNNTMIREVTDIPPDNVIIKNSISYLKFSDIDDVSISSAFNVTGIVKKIDQPTHVTTKADKLLSKRNVMFIDEFKNKAIVTAWGDLTAGLTWKQRDVVALQGVGLNDFNGMRNIKLYSSTIVNINDNSDESEKLQDKIESVMLT